MNFTDVIKVNKVFNSFEELFREIPVNDGMTISFHHHLREGDAVMFQVLKSIQKTGVKGITLACTSLMNTHDFIADMISEGTVSRIQTSGLKGKLAAMALNGGMQEPVIFRSHGSRARAVSDGELKVDIAFIAASAADMFGNANAIDGPNAFGSLGYGVWEAQNAKKTVIVTDYLSRGILRDISISQSYVDAVMIVPAIGNTAGVKEGSLKERSNPRDSVIAADVAKTIINCGIELDQSGIQMGSGSVSLQVGRYLSGYMKERDKKFKFGLGGITQDLIDMLNNGTFESLLDVQSFDPKACNSIRNNKNHHEIDVNTYANPLNRSSAVNFLDIAVLSATEIDTDWNVNVLTGSNGSIIGAIGGHQDVAAASKITIIAAPLFRNRIGVIRKKVTTVVTPGENIDILVTDFGIAVKESRQDIIKNLTDNGIKVLKIEDLYKKCISFTSEPCTVGFTDKVAAIVQTPDGKVQDYIYKKV